MDATDTAQIRAMIEKASEHFGRLDILVNNSRGCCYSSERPISPNCLWLRR
jgi:NAD(P)-dependent dehydrogenase (short-subunit alcohol dehydrogenase family)